MSTVIAIKVYNIATSLLLNMINTKLRSYFINFTTKKNWLLKQAYDDEILFIILFNQIY